MSSSAAYRALVDEALHAEISGWDFGWLEGRAVGGDPVGWSYANVARHRLRDVARVLDIDTGGGEVLGSLVPLPAHVVAAEGWAPNLPIARSRLEPLGVSVRADLPDGRLPADDGEMDLVLNRHGRMPVDEIRRVLAPGGSLVTQQVGSRNSLDLNEALGLPPPTDPDAHTLATVRAALVEAGFVVERASEEFPEHAFGDIGAVVYQLRAVPWQVPDFDVITYDAALRALDRRIRAEGRVVFHDHRFLIEATWPAGRRPTPAGS